MYKVEIGCMNVYIVVRIGYENRYIQGSLFPMY